MFDARTTPVIISVGESIERENLVTTIDLATNAAQMALDGAPGIDEFIDRLTVIPAIFSPAPNNPATEIARNLGLDHIKLEVGQQGGNGPQWLVNRAAEDIAAGELSTTLIVGAEATRSMKTSMKTSTKKGKSLVVEKIKTDAKADEVIGVPFGRGLSEAELAIDLTAPMELYAVFESALAFSAGRTLEQQREFLGEIYVNFSKVAAKNPYAWFQTEYTPKEISEISDNNRLISAPYTKRFNSFPNVDQGAALLVTSLEVAENLGLDEQVMYIWAGATNTDVHPIERPNLDSSPAMKAASEAMFENAGISVDDIDAFELYSCFPSAVGAAANALGIEMDDNRGLTLVGGLPFFGGPGNNYITHCIAAAFRRLQQNSGLIYIGANGGFLSKHSLGIYGSDVNTRAFIKTDTSEQQKTIDENIIAYTLVAEGEAIIEAGTVMYDRNGQASSAPVFARLEDGRRIAADADAQTLASMAGIELVQRKIYVSGSPLSYRLIS